MNSFKVSIIGCGDIGFLFDHMKKTEGALTHFKAFNDSDKFEIVSVCEIRKDIQEIINSEYKIKVYDDYGRMYEESNPEVVVIASNDESHFEILKRTADYSPRLVFCEKPLSLDYIKAKEIVELYSERNIPLQVNFTRRFLDEFYCIEKMLRKKELGELECVTFYYSRGLIHNASHYLDLVNWYIGETEKNVINVSVKDGLTKSDGTYSFDMIYENGLEVRFIGLNPSKLSFAEVDFIGTKGRVKFNYKNEIEKFSVQENEMFKGYSSYNLYECRPVRFEKALPNAADNIFSVLNGTGELKSPASNSIKIFELINRIRGNQSCQD
ncbi:MAG TPA: Gfo/Idh/MocA family oxidoreductase [Ignavibacteria bacterium]|nr:Gfo/Idh/MocA family oxidoreductase [Ignavibacteria bacterium]